MNQEIIKYPLLKSITDKIIAILIIIIFIPIFILIFTAMIISMFFLSEDRGSFFYKEKRISQSKIFNIIKFRIVKAKVAQKAFKENICIRDFENDLSNLTWAGRFFIKKWYLDELPQLFNILKGDMSLVGPRPLVKSIVDEQIKNGIYFRNQIKAGWTSPGQVHYKGLILEKGKNREDLDQKYVEKCQKWPVFKLWIYDFYILLLTFFVMIRGKGFIY